MRSQKFVRKLRPGAVALVCAAGVAILVGAAAAISQGGPQPLNRPGTAAALVTLDGTSARLICPTVQFHKRAVAYCMSAQACHGLSRDLGEFRPSAAANRSAAAIFNAIRQGLCPG